MLRLLHINTGEQSGVENLPGVQGSDVQVDSVKSVLEGIIASKQNQYDGIIFDEPSDSVNGLEVLNTLRQNEVNAPVLFNNADSRTARVYEQDNRRRFDLESENADQTVSSFISSLRQEETRRYSDLSFSQLQSIVDIASVPVLVLNQYASIVYANQMACDYLQFNHPSDLFNNSLNRIFPLKSALSGRKDIPSLISERNAREQSFYWEIIANSGERKCVSVRANRISDSGPVTTVLQFLVGNERTSATAATQSNEELYVSVYCNSKIIRSGLEFALGDSPYYFDYFDGTSQSIDEDTFVGSALSIYACSHLNETELPRLKEMISKAGGRPVLAVSLAADAKTVEAALAAGVHGFIIGEDEFENSAEALEVLRLGGYWLTEETGVLPGLDAKRKINPEDNALIARLTKRERQVLTMLAKGMKNHDIADELELSYRTVVTHVYNMYRKLNLTSRTEAIHLAISSGLVEV